MTITRRSTCADETTLTVTLLENQAGLCLRGEADTLGAETLRQAIAALAAGVREVHLDLAALSFIDVCCTRELLTLARRPARPRLILHQPPPSLIRLIGLLGLDCSQVPAPPGNGTGNGSTVSIQAT
jgi:anti-anti-sigma regulatory factor